jgi:mono/diheme cytochrome c family protein
VSAYDAGPRAGEAPVDPSLVKKGEALFQSKGCSACHGFGRRISCPDLNGVTMRRTAAWMEHQILHPDVMTKQDPIAHQLFAQYSLQMPNQGLTADEAHAVIEFLKNKNRETAAAK